MRPGRFDTWRSICCAPAASDCGAGTRGGTSFRAPGTSANGIHAGIAVGRGVLMQLGGAGLWVVPYRRLFGPSWALSGGRGLRSSLDEARVRRRIGCVSRLPVSGGAAIARVCLRLDYRSLRPRQDRPPADSQAIVRSIVVIKSSPFRFDNPRVNAASAPAPRGRLGRRPLQTGEGT